MWWWNEQQSASEYREGDIDVVVVVVLVVICVEGDRRGRGLCGGAGGRQPGRTYASLGRGPCSLPRRGGSRTPLWKGSDPMYLLLHQYFLPQAFSLFLAPRLLHRLLPDRRVVSASSARPSSNHPRARPAVPQGVLRKNRKHSESKVLQNGAKIGRGGRS